MYLRNHFSVCVFADSSLTLTNWLSNKSGSIRSATLHTTLDDPVGRTVWRADCAYRKWESISWYVNSTIGINTDDIGCRNKIPKLTLQSHVVSFFRPFKTLPAEQLFVQTDPSRFPLEQVQTAEFGTSPAWTGKSAGSQPGWHVPWLQTSFSVSLPEHPPFIEHVRVLDRVPSSHVTEQLDQVLHCPQVPTGGHVGALQTSVSCAEPEHGPCAALFWHVRLRSREPPPQVTVQLDQFVQSDHPNGAGVGQAWALQVCVSVSAPLQLFCTEQTRDRSWSPTPHVTEHVDQWDQAPHWPCWAHSPYLCSSLSTKSTQAPWQFFVLYVHVFVAQSHLQWCSSSMIAVKVIAISPTFISWARCMV